MHITGKKSYHSMDIGLEVTIAGVTREMDANVEFSASYGAIGIPKSRRVPGDDDLEIEIDKVTVKANAKGKDVNVCINFLLSDEQWAEIEAECYRHDFEPDWDALASQRGMH